MIGVILAGGMASRLGRIDKGELIVSGQQIIDRAVATLRAQCDKVIISSNADPALFGRFGCEIVADETSDRLGPLAGVLAALEAVAALHTSTRFVVTVPTDAPFLPHDLVARLEDERVRDQALIACARSGGRVHPTSALWSVDLRHDLRVALGEGLRRMQGFFARHPIVYADWPTSPRDPFFNVNTPEDLAEAERIANNVA